MPKRDEKAQSDNFQLISANNVLIESENLFVEGITSVSLIEVQSRLVPNLTEESFAEKYQASVEIQEKSPTTVLRKGKKIHFLGNYEPNLFEEIYKSKTIAQSNYFEVIHAYDWLTFPTAIAAKQVSGKPLVVHIHSTDFDRSGGSANPVIYDIEKQGMDAADQIIAVSNRIKQRLIEQYFIPTDKIITVYNAVEPGYHVTLSDIKKKRNQKIVTFLGRITVQKWPEYFVEVARMVISRMKNVHFVMAGNGEM